MDKLTEADVMPSYERTAVAVAKPATKGKRKCQPKTTATRKPVAVPHTDVRRWATFGVAFTLALSGLLNGYANAQHAPLAAAGWLMGLAVPVLVLVLSKVAGEKVRAGQKPVAWFAGGSGIALLFLSVWHCSEAIAILTGSPVARRCRWPWRSTAGLWRARWR